jgi:integrase
MGDIDTPKGRKGNAHLANRGGVGRTLNDLAVWRPLLIDQSPEAYLFPGERKTPLSRANIWKRHMLPKLEMVGLGWATFQVLRRTNALLSRKANVDDKVVADQRGHGLGMSLEVYSHSDLGQKIEAVNCIEAEGLQK